MDSASKVCKKGSFVTNLKQLSIPWKAIRSKTIWIGNSLDIKVCIRLFRVHSIIIPIAAYVMAYELGRSLQIKYKFCVLAYQNDMWNKPKHYVRIGKSVHCYTSHIWGYILISYHRVDTLNDS